MTAPPRSAAATYTEFLEAHGLTADDAAAGNFSQQVAAAAQHVRDLHVAECRRIVSVVEAERRDTMRADEQRTFDKHRTQSDLFGSLVNLTNRSQRVDQSRAAHGNVRGEGFGQWHQIGGGETYHREDRSTSWLRDMFAVARGQAGANEARERLERNNREVATETRALTTTDGAGGDFVPPLWAINDYINVARQARPTADAIRKEQLPPGTDLINVPKIVTGTAVAQQATQNTTVQNTDATTGAVAAAVVTLAGGQTLSQQMIDQSPIATDQVLLQDLIMDYAVKVNLFVLSNNATNAVGLLNISGVNAQTYTDASPTTGKLYAQIAQGAQLIQTNRFLPPDTIVMAPRRWAAFLSALDSTGRPLVSPQPNGPQNTVGTAQAAAQGVVGQLLGMTVVVDPSVPTNLGAGTNQDPVIVMRGDDQVLYEGNLRAEVFREFKADTLGVYLRVFNYAAFTTRYPKSITLINGTGLVPPTYGS